MTTVEVAEAYVDDCVAAHAEGKLTAVDAAKAKWWAAEVQSDVLDECVQLHGGYGFMNEYRVARAWKDARVNKIWAGTNEIMKELIGRDLGLLTERSDGPQSRGENTLRMPAGIRRVLSSRLCLVR